MADSYSTIARDNILPRSRGSAVPEVFAEWEVTGRVKDFGTGAADCQLCEQERLRYHFQIRNRFTEDILWVGSSCILRFGIRVILAGRQVSGKKAEGHLSGLVSDFRFQACIAALREVLAAEPNQILEHALDYLQEHGSLTPKFAFVVLWRLQVNKIDHSPTLLKINLRRQRYMRDLESMSQFKIRLLWPALSSSQRRRAIAAGIRPPN